MTLESKLCLICDDVAVLEVMSVKGQFAPLCETCLRDYFLDDGGMIADEVRKYFADGARYDRPRPRTSDMARGAQQLQTDETPGEYRTDEQEKG